MNNELIKIIKARNIHPISYKKIKNIYVINNRYAIKFNTNNYDIYKYLVTKNFLLFPKNYSNINDNYDMSLYIEDLNINKDQKVNDYIKIISLLHQKTSYRREIGLDEIKEKYENINNRINYLRDYYLKLNDEIDSSLFFSPSSYLLIRNISLIYSMLDRISVLLNDIYKEIKDTKSIRVSLLHNNVDLDHLIINEGEYLISWDYSYFDNPIYEIEKIYRKYTCEIELNDLIKIYESINKLTNIEKKLLIINLSIPKEIKLTSDTYFDTKLVNDEINYLTKVNELLIKYQNEL